jgi:hypothetical protein
VLIWSVQDWRVDQQRAFPFRVGPNDPDLRLASPEARFAPENRSYFLPSARNAKVPERSASFAVVSSHRAANGPGLEAVKKSEHSVGFMF